MVFRNGCVGKYFLSVQELERIHMRSAFDDFKMEMRPGGKPGIAAPRDILPLLHVLAALHPHILERCP